MKKHKRMCSFWKQLYKKFRQVPSKKSRWNCFLNKVAGYLTLTGNILLGNLWNLQNRFHKKHPRMLASVISCRWKKYLIRFDVQWHVPPGIECITDVWRPFMIFILVCTVHSSSCFIHLDKWQRHDHCLDYT